MSLFALENLTYYYPESETPALKKINLTVEEGEMMLVVGGSGSGKSSLVRVLAGLIPDFYGGRIQGRATFAGQDLADLDRRYLAGQVGMVFQDPEKQLVMTGVESEIAFGLENLGLPLAEMAYRLAEVSAFLGLAGIKDRFTGSLSGGEKQKLALASVLAMHPRVLVLDEPTSQLDPQAAEELLNLIRRLNEEMGYTVVLVEQRLERCFHLADRLVVMENGEIIKEGPAAEVARWQVKNGIPFVPPVAAFFASLDHGILPLTVKEGRQVLKKYARLIPPRKQEEKPPPSAAGEILLEMQDIWFNYPNGREVLKGVNCWVQDGELLVVMGENAAGKSTLLKQAAGLLKPGRGWVRLKGRDTRDCSLTVREVGYLSQNPNDYLFQDTVEEELLFTLHNLKLADDGIVTEILEKLGIACYRRVNPRDLSSGERQRVALAAVLVARPPVLVLDEPTRGLDPRLKRELGHFLRDLKQEGTGVIVVTHDVEFAAEYADRVAVMFDGEIVNDGPKEEILGGSLFYSPQMNRLFRGLDESVLTTADGLRCFHLFEEDSYAAR